MKQVRSVSKYLFESKSLIPTIPEITNGENFDKFVSVLKYNIRVPVLKSKATSLTETAQIASSVLSTILGARRTRQGYQSEISLYVPEGPTSKEIGNIQAHVPCLQEMKRNEKKTLDGMDV